MKLLDLEPKWLMLGEKKSWHLDGDIKSADGILFVCPTCLVANNMVRPGVHSIICWRPCVPADVHPGPGRWEFEGDDFSNLTLVAGSSSVRLTSGCKAHFHITKGEIKPT